MVNGPFPLTWTIISLRESPRQYISPPEIDITSGKTGDTSLVFIEQVISSEKYAVITTGEPSDKIPEIV